MVTGNKAMDEGVPDVIVGFLDLVEKESRIICVVVAIETGL